MSGPANAERLGPARRLWAGRFQAVLTTQSQAEPDYPFPSLVPYCLDHQGRVLLLLSRLAQHSRNLAADRHCGLLVSELTQGDIQQTTRIACLGEADPVNPVDQAAYRRWFRYFPHTLPYHEQLDFGLYRLTPRRFHFNGGFATARWLTCDQVLRPSPLDDHQETALLTNLEELAQALCAHHSAGTDVPGRLAGLDPWGLDLACGERLIRLDLPGPLTDPDRIREALMDHMRSGDSC